MTLLAVAQVVADTLTGSNPVLTPVTSGEPEMNLWDMACKGGCQSLHFTSFLNVR